MHVHKSQHCMWFTQRSHLNVHVLNMRRQIGRVASSPSRFILARTTQANLQSASSPQVSSILMSTLLELCAYLSSMRTM
jgi:hypothetical protein